MFCRQQDVARQCQLQPTAAAGAVDRHDDRLVHARQFLQATKAAHAVIAIHGIASGGGFQIPARAKEFVPRASHNRDTQIRIIAKNRKHIAHDTAGGQVNGIGLGPVQRDLKDIPVPRGFDGVVSHGVLLL